MGRTLESTVGRGLEMPGYIDRRRGGMYAKALSALVEYVQKGA